MAGFGETGEQPVERRALVLRVAAGAEDRLRRRPLRELRLELEPLRDGDGPVGDVAFDQLAGLVEPLGEELAWNLAEQVVHRGVARRWQEGHEHAQHSIALVPPPGRPDAAVAGALRHSGSEAGSYLRRGRPLRIPSALAPLGDRSCAGSSPAGALG